MKKTVVVLLVLFAVSLATAGCDSENRADNPKNVDPINVTDSNRLAAPDYAVEYGNGVYYFPWTKANFGNSLSRFLKTHPNLEVSAIAGADVSTGYAGITAGYFVTFRPKAQPQK